MSFHFSRKFWKRMTTALFIIAGLLVLAATVGVWLGAEFMVRPKRRTLEPRHRELLARPSEFGMKLEQFTITTSDGFALKAFLANPIPETQMGEAARTRRMLDRLDDAGVAESDTIRGTVYFLHGRGGVKENMLTIAQRFVAANYRCVVYDARAHGESEGTFSTFGFLETGDLARVMDHTEDLLRMRGEKPRQRIGFGISLGAATLLQALEKESSIDLGIAVAPFADLREQIRRTGQRASSWKIPSHIPDIVTKLGGSRANFDPFSIKPLRSAEQIRVPVFVAHGRLDGVISIEDSRQIFAALTHPNKQWREVPEGYHGNVLAEGGDDLYQEMVEFCLKHRKQDANVGAPST